MMSRKYGWWLARDFVVERSVLPLLLAIVLLGALTLDPKFRASPGTFMDDPSSSALVRGSLMWYAVASVLFAVIGMISEDRTSGRYRVLFAKPTSILGYYLGMFVIRGLCVTVLFAVVIGGSSAIFRTNSLWSMVALAPLMFVLLGGPAFLLSAVTRFDGVILVLTAVVGYLSLDHIDVIAYALPPVWILKSLALQQVGATPLPSAAHMIWALAYGGLGLLLGAYALANLRFKASIT